MVRLDLYAVLGWSCAARIAPAILFGERFRYRASTPPWLHRLNLLAGLEKLTTQPDFPAVLARSPSVQMYEQD